MARYEYNTTPNGKDWDVRGRHHVRRGLDTIFVTGHEPTGIHIWHPAYEKCMCAMVILDVKCNGVPRNDLNIVRLAPLGDYYIGTTRPGSDGRILGTYGTLVVGSGGLGDDKGDPHRHR